MNVKYSDITASVPENSTFFFALLWASLITFCCCCCWKLTELGQFRFVYTRLLEWKCAKAFRQMNNFQFVKMPAEKKQTHTYTLILGWKRVSECYTHRQTHTTISRTREFRRKLSLPKRKFALIQGYGRQNWSAIAVGKNTHTHLYKTLKFFSIFTSIHTKICENLRIKHHSPFHSVQSGK